MRKEIPNILTMARIGLIFIFLILAANAGEIDCTEVTHQHRWIRIIACILAFIAGATDFLDGYLARKWQVVSDLGALLDPLADKIFVTATMLIMVEFHLMPAWIAVVIISREFMVTGLRMVALKHGVVISADRWGKWKTALQMLMLALAGISWINVDVDLKTYVFYGIRLWYVWLVFLAAIALLTVGSGVSYFVKYRNLLKDNPEKA